MVTTQLHWNGAGSLCLIATVTSPNWVEPDRCSDQEQRDALTIPQIIDAMKKGNERFRSGTTRPHDYLARKRASASGQYPATIVLGCVDSRVPAEIVFDAGIGDTFNAGVAGNVVNDDMLGSMEFACAVTGAKVVFVLDIRRAARSKERSTMS